MIKTYISTRYYIAILSIVLCMAACSHHSAHWETLAQVESFIEERPDSALNVLQGMGKDELSGMEEKAKHALLLSMAMDKSYIDRTDFDVLQPAIDYYEDNGTPTERMQMLYYKGKVHYINGQYAQALTCYSDAIKKGNSSYDILTKAKLHDAQGDIYALLTEWDMSINSKLLATDFYAKSDYVDSYVKCLLDIFNCYVNNGDYSNAEKHLNEYNKYRGNISSHTLSKYYSYIINYLIATSKFDKIEATVQEYQSNVTEEHLDYLSIAYAYVALCDINKVAETLSKNESVDGTVNILNQYAIIAALNAYIDEGRNMLEAYKESLVERDSTLYSIYKSDIQYMQQKYNEDVLQGKEEVAKRTKTIITFFCIIALIIALYILNITRKKLRGSRAKHLLLESEKLKYERLYSEATAEIDTLTKIIEDSSIKDETRDVIGKRLEVLNKVIISHITDTGSANKKAFQELEALVADKESFIESTKLTIKGNYPEFISYLKKQGLTDEEIGICCLYAMGLKGKDIKAYTNQPRHYNKSADIRHKLGLTENDTNLSIFLREMLEKSICKTFD